MDRKYHTGWTLATALVAIVQLVLATTLKVPQDYMSIQMALDSLHSGDTVEVAFGNYPEILQAPCQPFVLRGVDAEMRPVIDPGAGNRAARLNLCGNGPIVLENFVIRNTITTGWHYGGIVCEDSMALEIRKCDFISTGVAICRATKRPALTLTDCDFDRCLERAVVVNEEYFYGSGTVTARRCTFSGRVNDGGLLGLWDGSALDSCWFHDVLWYGAVLCTGDSVRVENCRFGPSDSLYHAIRIEHREDQQTPSINVEIRDNLFADIGFNASMIYVRGDCQAHRVANIEGNVFRDNYGTFSGWCTYGIVEVQAGNNCFDLPVDVRIANNDINTCDSDLTANGLQMLAGGGGVIEGNTFRQFRTNQYDPTAVAILNRATNPPTLYNNRFIDTGTAVHVDTMRVQTDSARSPVDARWNWWGDSNGPTHPGNPGGHGAAIVGTGVEWVIYVPWLTDSTQQVLVPPKHEAVVRSASVMRVYPNPFNSQAEIQLTVDKAGVYRVELFNLVGQRVGELYQGSVARETTVRLDAEEMKLSSGVYFVRVGNGQRKGVATEKILLLR